MKLVAPDHLFLLSSELTASRSIWTLSTNSLPTLLLTSTMTPAVLIHMQMFHLLTRSRQDNFTFSVNSKYSSDLWVLKKLPQDLISSRTGSSKTAFQLAPVITHLFTLTLITGKPPIHWKKTIISPAPKVSKPNTLSDLRPISVTPILSRILERIIVQHYLIPSLPPDELADQCAYRISGFTTAAIIDILHHVTNLLESNKYVGCLFIDFTKAFDTVNHPQLFSKFHRLSLPPTILAWIVNFLTGRTQNVIFAGVQSSPLPITRSIVQGSGLGPALYITYKADLHTISPQTLFVNLLMILLLAILKIQM